MEVRSTTFATREKKGEKGKERKEGERQERCSCLCVAPVRVIDPAGDFLISGESDEVNTSPGLQIRAGPINFLHLSCGSCAPLSHVVKGKRFERANNRTSASG